jgi:hypothetical protein
MHRRSNFCGSFLGGCRIGITETVNGSKRPVRRTEGQKD